MLQTRHSLSLDRSPFYTRDHLMITIRPPVDPENVPELEAEAAWFGNVYGTHHYYNGCGDWPRGDCSILYIDMADGVTEDALVSALLNILEEQ